MITIERYEKIYKNLNIFDLMVYFADYINKINFFKVIMIAKGYFSEKHFILYEKNDKFCLRLFANISNVFNKLINSLVNANMIRKDSSTFYKKIRGVNINIDIIKSAIVKEYLANGNGKIKEKDKFGNGAIQFELTILCAGEGKSWGYTYIYITKELIRKYNLKKGEKVKVIVERLQLINSKNDFDLL